MNIELVHALRVDVISSRTPSDDRAEYNNRSKVLSVYIGPNRPTPVGVNIDALLILDVDANGEIHGMEMLLPPSRWKRSREYAQPNDARAGRLLLPDASRGRSLQLDTGLAVFKKPSSQTIFCRISDQSGTEMRAVRISRHVIADVRGENLCGLWISGIPV